MTDQELLAAIVNAWTDAGVSPVHHARAQAWLEMHWPTLANAVKDAVRHAQR